MIVLLHSGITDARQWARELREWPVAASAPDVHGFELDEAAVLVGNSYGGRIALERAVEQPALVRGLVLVAPALPGTELSAELAAIDAKEEELVEAGHLDDAAQLMVETWVPGAPAAVQQYVHEAQARAYTLPWTPPVRLDPPVADRLAEVRAPVLLVEGELDRPEFRSILDRLERELPDVRGRVRIPGAHHLPNLESPAAFDAAVLPFLATL
ncbi:MAG: alpha/beta fold hydrolase [Gaiellaceae bacterium]